MGVNKGAVTGRLTRDPEIKMFGQGGKVATLAVAVDNRKKDQATGQWVTEPMTVDFSAFDSGDRKWATWSESLKAGQQVYIEFHLKVDHWTDKKTNQPRQSLKLMLDDLQLAGFTATQTAQAQPKAPATAADDHGPF